MKKKGFTLIELLAVIVIIGILSGVSIAAYSKFVKSAKSEKEEQNEKIIINAAKSYLESNTNYKPKEIGETVQIYLRTLKEANFLKEDIVNSKGASCMDESYIEVHKTGYKDYTYTSFLKCGDEYTDNKNIPEPVIDNVKVINTDVKNAAISITVRGDSSNSTEIESYSYTIIGKTSSNSSKKENYSSGTLPGQGKKRITIKNIKLSEYLDVTKYNTFDIQVIVRNSKGGYKKRIFKDISFEDTKDPLCKNITGQSKGDEDWTNEKRTITVDCDDENGSGCVRDSFSKIWPRENEKSIEKGTIDIEDNTGKKHTCEVLVNVDTISPTIKITARNIKTGDVLFTKTTEINKNLTISPSDYNGSNWLNKITAPQGVQYDIEVKDDMYLTEYKWEENNSNISSGSNNSTITALNNNKTQKVTINKAHRKDSSTKSYILNEDGIRYAKITAKDKAGNETVIIINLNLDRVDPTCTPSITDLKGKTYTPGTWLKKGEGVNIYGKCSDSTSKCTGDLTPLTYNTDMEAQVGWNSSDKVYDNAGNSVSCEKKYQVKIDTIPPEVSVNVTPKNRKNSVLTKTATPGETTSIGESEYSIKVTSNYWLNAASYPEGIAYNMTITDNKYLYNELWQTNESNLSIGTANSVIKKIPASNNWPTTYTQPSTGHLTSQQVTHTLEGDGLRYGVFQVSDRAGNTTLVNMRANIDHTPPKITIHPYRIRTLNGTSYTSVYGNAYYNPNNPSQSEVSSTEQPTITVSSYQYVADNDNWMNKDYYPNGVAYKITMEDSIAQLAKYKWVPGDYISGQDNNTSLPNSGYTTISSNTTSYGSSLTGFTLTGNGKRYARMIVYDLAENSNIGHMYAKIDNKPPICRYNQASCSPGSRYGWVNTSRTVSLYCSDVLGGSNCYTPSYEETFSINGKTSYFYPGSGKKRAIYDNAGNEALCSTTVTTCIDKEKPYTPYVNINGIVEKSGEGSINSYDCYRNRKENSKGEEYCYANISVKNNQTYYWTVHLSSHDDESGVYKYYKSESCKDRSNNLIVIYDDEELGYDTDNDHGYPECTVRFYTEDYLGNKSDQLFLKYTFNYYG